LPAADAHPENQPIKCSVREAVEREKQKVIFQQPQKQKRIFEQRQNTQNYSHQGMIRDYLDDIGHVMRKGIGL
jgi:hypothetical protein